MEKLEKCDYENKIINNISDILAIDYNNSSKIFHFLQEYNESAILNSCLKDVKVDNNENTKGLLINNGLYYINIKIATLVIIAFILDITLTHGILTLLQEITGFNTNAFIKLSPEDGESCIIKETLLSKDQIVNSNLLIENNKECVNNDIAGCRFRSEGACDCSPEAVGAVLIKLSNLSIYRRLNDDSYQIILL